MIRMCLQPGKRIDRCSSMHAEGSFQMQLSCGVTDGAVKAILSTVLEMRSKCVGEPGPAPLQRRTVHSQPRLGYARLRAALPH